MNINEVPAYQSQWQATVNSIEGVPPDRVPAGSAFMATGQTIALSHQIRLYQYAYDNNFLGNLLSTLEQDLENLTSALQQKALSNAVTASTDVQGAVSLVTTGQQQTQSINQSADEANDEIKSSQQTFRKVIHELERKHRKKQATGSAASKDSPTESSLTEFGGFIPGELDAALKGLLGHEALKQALGDATKSGGVKGQGIRLDVVKRTTKVAPRSPGVTSPPTGVAPRSAGVIPSAAGGTSPSTGVAPSSAAEVTSPSTIGEVQSILAALLIGIQSKVFQRSNTIALQQVSQAFPNANLQEPKLGLFTDILALEGILGVNASGLIPSLLRTLLQKNVSQLALADIEATVPKLAPQLEQALLQLNTKRVLSSLPDQLRIDIVKLLQKIQQQVEEAGLQPNGVEGAAAPEIPALRQSLLAFLGQQFPDLSTNQREQFGERILSVLFGPTTIPSREVEAFKNNHEVAPSASRTNPKNPPPPLSTVLTENQLNELQEFINQLRLPKALRALLGAQGAPPSSAQTELVRQVQLQQISKAFQDEAQQVVATVAQTLSAQEQSRLVRNIDANLSSLGDQLLSERLAAASAAAEQQQDALASAEADASQVSTDEASTEATADQQRSALAAASQAAASQNANTQTGQLADKAYLLTALANLQRVKDRELQESLKASLQAPLTAGLTPALQQTGVQNAQILAGQIAQALIKPEFAVGVLKKLQQQPSTAAVAAVAETKAKEIVESGKEKEFSTLPAVAESFIQLSYVQQQNKVQDRQAFDTKMEENRSSPNVKETNYLYVFLQNQLDPGVKYERRGGIQPALMEHTSQIDKETRGLHGVV